MRKQTKLVAVLSAAALLAIGASMTSFAATRGWVQEGEDWVYLDNSGERVYNQWKRSGNNYYYLNEEGIMATDTLIHDETVEAWYYVDENGVKLMNQWKQLPNDEGEQVGDITPDVLYYRFDGTGKAIRSKDDDLKISTVDGKIYGFDVEGRMASGWQTVQTATEERIYNFGTELEGWARTGWQYMEPDEKLGREDYDSLEWFWFDPANGRAARDTTKYINGRYYSFDENGVMLHDWYNITTLPAAASNGKAYASSNGTLSSGWVLTTDMDDDDGDDYWYYLVTLRDGSNVKRSVPYNYFPTDAPAELGEEGVRAKVIKNKTYIFNTNGKMLTGFVAIDEGSLSEELKALAVNGNGESQVVSGATNELAEFCGADKPFGNTDNTAYAIKGRTLEEGLYYFNEAGGSVEGQMLTGRTAVTTDGDTYYYYFNKAGNTNTAGDFGMALTSTVKDGYLYGRNGRCLAAEDGNSFAVYEVSNIGKYNDGTGLYEIKLPGKTGGTEKVIDSTIPDEAKKADVDAAYIVVSKTGRIKQSGTATIDGIKYTIKNYKVVNTNAIDN